MEFVVIGIFVVIISSVWFSDWKPYQSFAKKDEGWLPFPLVGKEWFDASPNKINGAYDYWKKIKVFFNDDLTGDKNSPIDLAIAVSASSLWLNEFCNFAKQCFCVYEKKDASYVVTKADLAELQKWIRKNNTNLALQYNFFMEDFCDPTYPLFFYNGDDAPCISISQFEQIGRLLDLHTQGDELKSGIKNLSFEKSALFVEDWKVIILLPIFFWWKDFVSAIEKDLQQTEAHDRTNRLHNFVSMNKEFFLGLSFLSLLSITSGYPQKKIKEYVRQNTDQILNAVRELIEQNLSPETLLEKGT